MRSYLRVVVSSPVPGRTAAFLGDLREAWRTADDAQRDALTRMLFVQVRIKVDWVAAVEPQPSFAPFFSWDCQVRRLSGGSDGGWFRVFYRSGSALSHSIPRFAGRFRASSSLATVA
jgi:hypothetical protein